ncbi:MAG: hypothetical protein U5R30_12670 [Deltaproteobacteria bacterium]|nr:hypothetical protein [Deltaproteobacteria bacterium]
MVTTARSRLIRDFSITIAKNDRICIVGLDGWRQDHAPEVSWPAPCNHRPAASAGIPNVVIGAFEQTNRKTLVETRTVEEEILYADPDTSRQLACNAIPARRDDVRGPRCPEKNRRVVRW